MYRTLAFFLALVCIVSMARTGTAQDEDLRTRPVGKLRPVDPLDPLGPDTTDPTAISQRGDPDYTAVHWYDPNHPNLGDNGMQVRIYDISKGEFKQDAINAFINKYPALKTGTQNIWVSKNIYTRQEELKKQIAAERQRFGRKWISPDWVNTPSMSVGGKPNLVRGLEAPKRQDTLDGTVWIPFGDNFKPGDAWSFSNGIMQWISGQYGPGRDSRYTYRVEGNKLYTRYMTSNPQYSNEHETTINGDEMSGWIQARRR